MICMHLRRMHFRANLRTIGPTFDFENNQIGLKVVRRWLVTVAGEDSEA